MNDPNIEPVKLIDFDLETLSNVSEALKREIEHLGSMAKETEIRSRYDILQNTANQLMDFRVQVLNAFSRVKESEKITNS